MQDMTSTTFVILALVCAVAVLVLCTVKLKIHPFFALIATTVTFALISGMSMEDIGREFSGRDHSTIVYSLKAMEQNLENDRRLKETVEDIIKNVRS